jgi:serine protease
MGFRRVGAGRARWVATLVALATITPLMASTAGAQAQNPKGQALQPRVTTSKMAWAAQPVDPSNRRVILKFREGTAVRLRGGGFVTSAPVDLSGVNAVLQRFPGTTAARMFQRTEAELTKEKAQVEARSNRQQADLNLYYRLVAPDGADVIALMADLNRLDVVEAASSEPRAVPPPTHTDFTPQQGYRAAAPGGIDANFAATLPGGKGENITIADIEYSWNVNHEDLAKAPGALLANGTPADPFSDNNHGTAVLGEIISDENTFGVTGIVSGAGLRLVNASDTNGYALANAINVATGALQPGDVMLIEQQTAGPNGCDATQVGCVAVEWVQAFYDAIVVAVGAGIIVVEAAGNGAQDLDVAALYGSPFPGGRPDSGAIIVGAGNAPGCTAPPRGRLAFSNSGARVNLQGWGECVTTSGYGNLQGGADPNHWYTDSFSGTSSASPIVAGAAGVISSVAQERGVTLTSQEIRTILRDTGTAQQFGLAGNIGPLPNLFRGLQGLSCSVPPPATITVAGPGLLTIGTPGNGVIYGTAGADRIAGLGGNDIVIGGDGADDMQGGDGDDMLCGDGGADRLAGGNGRDFLQGDGGNDDLAGGPANDVLFGNAGSDRLAGDDGVDRCVAGGDAGDFSAPAPHCDSFA